MTTEDLFECVLWTLALYGAVSLIRLAVPYIALLD